MTYNSFRIMDSFGCGILSLFRSFIFNDIFGSFLIFDILFCPPLASIFASNLSEIPDSASLVPISEAPSVSHPAGPFLPLSDLPLFAIRSHNS